MTLNIARIATLPTQAEKEFLVSSSRIQERVFS